VGKREVASALFVSVARAEFVSVVWAVTRAVGRAVVVAGGGGGGGGGGGIGCGSGCGEGSGSGGGGGGALSYILSFQLKLFPSIETSHT
jgi:hypothetical protein